MRIRAAEVRRFALPLVAPLCGPGGIAERREGFILRLVGEDGESGLGEASPPWWIGGCSLVETASALDRVTSDAPGRSVRDLHGMIAELPAAAASALDSAIADLEARRRGISVARLFGGDDAATIELAALLEGEAPAEVAASAAAARREGFRCVKLKIGGRGIDEEVRRVAAARSALGDACALRLDANRALDLGAARELCERIRRHRVASIEEPLERPSVDDLARLRRLGVAIALDESIASVEDLDPFAEAYAVDSIVVKLAAIGGFDAALRLARKASRLGIGVLVTDAIETSIGRSAAVHLAAALLDLPAPVGLGGARRLAGDVADPAFPAAPASTRVAAPGLGIRLRA